MSIEAIGAVQASRSAQQINDDDQLNMQANLPQAAAEMRQLQDTQLLSKAVTKIMDVKDIDRDGKLSQKEIGFEDRIFRKIDTDRSGFVEDQELRSKCKEVKEVIRNVADVVGMLHGGPNLSELQSLMNQKKF